MASGQLGDDLADTAVTVPGQKSGGIVNFLFAVPQCFAYVTKSPADIVRVHIGYTADPVLTIYGKQFRHDLVPAQCVEIDIHVGQTLATLVEEPLKQQVVLDGIDLCGIDAVADDGIGS